ncbi:MAG: ClbS/DfsB family four-helix bundle protein [Anaerolineales bacterium]|nr:ClbS/DfsB family four-helix bundle protein [Anaerolineales bacterium]
MPRPATKKQLLSAMQMEHEALEKALEPLTERQITAIRRTTKWSIKDVLAHLSAWEQMVIGWYETGRKGRTPAVPSEKYNWGQLPALNKEIYEKYRARSLKAVLRRFHESYAEVQKTIKGISEADLFTPGRYSWTKTTTLGSYFVSCTSSHYNWARKEIRKSLKQERRADTPRC